LTDLFLEKISSEILHTSKRIAPSYLKANDSGKITVKIIQRKSSGKIIFAEGKEDFADFLCSLLTIPLGGAVHLMEGYSCVGSVDGLYKSVVDLDEDYFTTKEVKNKFVDPVLALQFKMGKLIPFMSDDVPKCYCYVELYLDGSLIRMCYLTIHEKICNIYPKSCVAGEFVDPLSDTSDGGTTYIKGPTTYMATDDLVVTPSSSISVMSLLNSMNIPVDDLKEKVIRIGMEEVRAV